MYQSINETSALTSWPLQLGFLLPSPAANGSRKFVLLSQLEEGHFVDAGGEFQLELSLSAVRSTYEHRDDALNPTFGGLHLVGEGVYEPFS